jgi:hypothetical protein
MVYEVRMSGIELLLVLIVKHPARKGAVPSAATAIGAQLTPAPWNVTDP